MEFLRTCNEGEGHASRGCVVAITHPLVVGAVGRVGKLKGYGNAIVPPLAAAFIRAAIDAISEAEDLIAFEP